jgi:hypothetical protein
MKSKVVAASARRWFLTFSKQELQTMNSSTPTEESQSVFLPQIWHFIILPPLYHFLLLLAVVAALALFHGGLAAPALEVQIHLKLFAVHLDSVRIFSVSHFSIAPFLFLLELYHSIFNLSIGNFKNFGRPGPKVAGLAHDPVSHFDLDRQDNHIVVKFACVGVAAVVAAEVGAGCQIKGERMTVAVNHHAHAIVIEERISDTERAELHASLILCATDFDCH